MGRLSGAFACPAHPDHERPGPQHHGRSLGLPEDVVAHAGAAAAMRSVDGPTAPGPGLRPSVGHNPTISEPWPWPPDPYESHPVTRSTREKPVMLTDQSPTAHAKMPSEPCFRSSEGIRGWSLGESNP